MRTVLWRCSAVAVLSLEPLSPQDLCLRHHRPQNPHRVWNNNIVNMAITATSQLPTSIYLFKNVTSQLDIDLVESNL